MDRYSDLRNRTLRLQDNLREKLKEPLGYVVQSPDGEVFDSPVAAVGDVTFHNLILSGTIPFLAICDMKTRRGPEGEWDIVKDDARQNDYSFVNLENPPGLIVPEVWDIIKKAIDDYIAGGKRTFVHVDGEEDLLALVVIALVPEGWFVTYGMPARGMHIVRVGEKEKNKTLDVLREMAKDT